MFKEFIIQNWANVLLLLAFAILLQITVYLDKKTKRRLYLLIVGLLVLSVIVFAEFYLENEGEAGDIRLVLMCIRYSATPLIIAMIIYALAKNVRWILFIPALILTALDIVSIYTGIIFGLDDDGKLQRGILGYLPYIMVGFYAALLVIILVKRSNKRPSEIIPIGFLCFAFVSGLVLPFVIGKDYSRIFCVTVIISLFVYHVFTILQLTEKDALTGLLNRQSFYSAVNNDVKDIHALITLDMNGLKKINDMEGHAAGDKALETLASCFMQASTTRDSVYRLGGDEFIIVSRRTSEEEVCELIDRIRSLVSETKYSCSIGYSFCPDEITDIDELQKKSDEMMYKDKTEYYSQPGHKRYRS